MGLGAVIFSNHRYYARKVIPVMLICGLLFMIPTVSIMLVMRIRVLADKPLQSLDTELILQYDKGDKKAETVHTQGLVEPFNLHSFEKQPTEQKLAAISGIKKYSTALILWQFDPSNTLTIVGINPSDPLVGYRKVEKLIIGPKSRFFTANNAQEVLLERHFAKLFSYSPGGFFPLAGTQLRIIGIVDFKEQSNLSNAAVFLPYGTALTMSGQNSRVINQVFLSLTSATEITRVSQAINQAFPQLSLVSKDSLYKNLSAFNKLIYRAGHFLMFAVIPLTLLLLVWTLKIYHLEFASHRKILSILGWSKPALRQWQVWDISFVVAGGIIAAFIISAFTYWVLLPNLEIAPLLDQGFQL